MKDVAATGGSGEISALLAPAHGEDLIAHPEDGSESTPSTIDDFDHEIARTRQNEKLMTLLDGRLQTLKIPSEERTLRTSQVQYRVGVSFATPQTQLEPLLRYMRERRAEWLVLVAHFSRSSLKDA